MIKINPQNYVSDNVLSYEEMARAIEILKKQGKKIGLCTGSFDLLHPGHITHLESAKKMCDVLIVAIARDSFSSNKYPGSGRPIFSHDLRAFMISKLKPVDFVIFDDGGIESLILTKPDLYIKGKDYINEIDAGILRGKKVVESFGGKIAFTQDEKLSTNEIIRHIKEEIE